MSVEHVILALVALQLLLVIALICFAVWQIGALKTVNRALAWVYDRMVEAGARADTLRYGWKPEGPEHPAETEELGPEWEENLSKDPDLAQECPVVSLTDEERAILARMPDAYVIDEDPGAVLSRIRSMKRREESLET